MRAAHLLLPLLLNSLHSLSQLNNATFETWMKGDNIIGQAGTYGNLGVADLANKPGARDFSATWRDSNGNLWLFGGYGLDATNALGYLNDLWKYDPTGNKWTWIKGDNFSGAPATYGQQGVAHAANRPGGTFASVSWSDPSGNLWLFGGFGYTANGFGFLNSLWKYSPATNTWAWMKGDDATDQAGIYGTPGVAASANKPGARYGSRTWTDTNGNLWLFGGYGYDINSVGNLNDLWKYNISTNQWTWVKGDNVMNQPGVYGSQGIASVANKPGGRYLSISWTDTNDNLWLFGGYGNTASNEGQLNDLWKYNISTNQWTWVKGDNTIENRGIYGLQGQPYINNKPGSRYLGVSWTDANGSLWMFGGYGFDIHNEGYLNDLWKYDPASNNWTWVKGDSVVNQYGVYGIQGMTMASNKSGSRTSSVSWTDNNGHLWFFGGYGYDASSSGMLNDLWKISSLAAALPLRLIYFTGTFKNERTLLQWQTAGEANFSHFIIERSVDGHHFTEVGTKIGSANFIRNDYDYEDDAGNTTATRLFYRLKMVNVDGSYDYSRILVFDKVRVIPKLHVYPNPASQFVNVVFEQQKPGPVTIMIAGLNAVVLKKELHPATAGLTNIDIDISSLPSASYIISVVNGSGRSSQSFIKQ